MDNRRNHNIISSNASYNEKPLSLNKSYNEIKTDNNEYETKIITNRRRNHVLSVITSRDKPKTQNE